jgi:hypothetical protein
VNLCDGRVEKVTSRNPCATASAGFCATDPSFGTLLGDSFTLPSDESGHGLGGRRGTERAQHEIADGEPPPFQFSSRIRQNAGYAEHASVCALCAAHIKSSSQSNRGASVMQMQSNNRQVGNQLIRHVADVKISKLQSRMSTMPDLH